MSTALREPLSKIEPTIMAFSKKYKDFLNKPLIEYDNVAKIIDIDNDEDDIDDHYKLMFIKNPEKKIIDYDELDKKFIEEELKKEEEKYNDINIDLDDDDYYEDDEDYYEEDYYYEDEDYYYDEYY